MVMPGKRLCIVRVEYSISYYYGGGWEYQVAFHPVFYEEGEDVYEMVTDYYENQSDPYASTFSVRDVDIYDAIGEVIA